MEADISLASLSVSIAVVVGLVEVVKRIGLPDRFAPLLSVLFGIGAAFAFPAATPVVTVFTGVIIGLSASGLYSGTRAVAGK